MSTNKRKSDASDAQHSSKKARTAHASAQSFVDSILASPGAFPLPSSDDDIRDAFHDLAQYIRTLESRENGSALVKTPEELEALAENVRRAARSGIKNLMTGKAGYKNGTVRWTYDGICSDPDVFAVLVGLDEPPRWKTKKIYLDNFEDVLGERITKNAGFAGIFRITGKEVSVKWTESTGEFKLSGVYGNGVQPEYFY